MGLLIQFAINAIGLRLVVVLKVFAIGCDKLGIFFVGGDVGALGESEISWLSFFFLKFVWPIIHKFLICFGINVGSFLFLVPFCHFKRWAFVNGEISTSQY